MSTGTRRPYDAALALAQAFVDVIRHLVDRVEIAGSVRRQRPVVGDIELVVIPKFDRSSTDLFGDPGEPVNLLQRNLEQVPGVTKVVKSGPRHQSVIYTDGQAEPVQVDVFSATPMTWGLILALRTGGADFSKWLVTDRKRGGAKPTHFIVRDGQLLIGNKPAPIPTEQALFSLYGLRVIPLDQRERGYWSLDAMEPYLIRPASPITP